MKKEQSKQIDAMYEQFKAGEISRRDFVKYLGIAGVAAGIVGGPFGFGHKAFAAESITCHSWGGVVSEAFRKHA